MKNIVATLALVLALAAPAAAQTLTYGVFTGSDTPQGEVVGFDYPVTGPLSISTFLGSDFAFGIGPQVTAGQYWRFTPFGFAHRVYTLQTSPLWQAGIGTDFALTQDWAVRYRWARELEALKRDWTHFSIAYGF